MELIEQQDRYRVTFKIPKPRYLLRAIRRRIYRQVPTIVWCHACWGRIIPRCGGRFAFPSLPPFFTMCVRAFCRWQNAVFNTFYPLGPLAAVMAMAAFVGRHDCFVIAVAAVGVSVTGGDSHGWRCGLAIPFVSLHLGVGAVVARLSPPHPNFPSLVVRYRVAGGRGVVVAQRSDRILSLLPCL